jgi:hypothetical protein
MGKIEKVGIEKQTPKSTAESTLLLVKKEYP